MKKLIILFLTLLLNCSPIFAQVTPPDWSEFCPEKYIGAVYKNNNFNAIRYTKDVVLIVSLVGMPWGLIDANKYYEQERKNYWATRKINFDNEIKTCNDDLSNQTSCYMTIRQIENSKNSQYELLKEIQKTNAIRNYQMNQINNNLNGIRYGY